MNAGDKYTSHMCQYPVINISLKSAKKSNFAMAFDSIKRRIVEEYSRHKYLLNSTKLDQRQLNMLKKICIEGNATDDDFYNSLKFLSECLGEHFSEKVIILIDEYDVPLESAYYNGYYEQMIDFIRGFIHSEVKEMLNYYNQGAYENVVKDWYNGYEFGSETTSLESGLGRPDILIRPRSLRKEAIILEVKNVDDIDHIESACEEALKQIEDKKYEVALRREGFRKFIKYGIAFYKKECMVKKAGN